MFLSRFLLSVSLVAGGIAPSMAATVSNQTGTVLVSSNGGAYQPLAGSADLGPGSGVMVRPGGIATIAYDNCLVRVGSGFWTVQQAGPCTSGTTEIDFTTNKMSGGALDPPPPPPPRHDLLIIGG